MLHWYSALDPDTRRGVLLAAAILLPLATILDSLLLGRVIGYFNEKPKFGRLMSVLVVGLMGLVFAGSGIVYWLYLHHQYHWFTGKHWWFWPLVWVGMTLAAFTIPSRRSRLTGKAESEI
jgi:hypothetical protein